MVKAVVGTYNRSMDLMRKVYGPLVAKLNLKTSAGEKLHRTALMNLGRDASPSDVAPDELGCAETVNAINQQAFGDVIGGDVSTYRMQIALRSHNKFVRVDTPRPGDLIISPTGFAQVRRPKIKNGHVGIYSYGNTILSNDSFNNGKFLPNYQIQKWRERYKEYPVYFYRRISF